MALPSVTVGNSGGFSMPSQSWPILLLGQEWQTGGCRRFMFGLLGENALSESPPRLTISIGYVQANNRGWRKNRVAAESKPDIEAFVCYCS